MKRQDKKSKIKILSTGAFKKTAAQGGLIGSFGYKIIFLPVIGLFYILESYKLGLEGFLLMMFFVVISIAVLLKPAGDTEQFDINKDPGYEQWWWLIYPIKIDNSAPLPVFLAKPLLWIIFLVPLVLFILNNLKIIHFSIL